MRSSNRFDRFFDHPEYTNCGVKIRSKEDSLELIKQYLEQLIDDGLGESFLAQVYRKLILCSSYTV